MTTEIAASNAAGADAQARLDALRQRGRPGSRGAGAPDAPAPRRLQRRRRHPAAGARLVVGGLSAATALGLMGAMAGFGHHATAANAPAAPSPAPPATIIVHRRSTSTQLPAAAAAPPTGAPAAAQTAPAAPRIPRSTPRVAPSAAPATTKSKGS